MGARATSRLPAITKSLTIIGAFDPAFTDPDPDMYESVLDAQWGGSVISITNAGDVQLMHLTVTHGDGTGNCSSSGCGGGIYATETSLHVGHCVITDNVGSTVGQGNGGGIYLENNLVTDHVGIWESHIVSNTACADASSTGRGGGIFLIGVDDADVVMNVIQGNKAAIGSGDGDGGGLCLVSSSVVRVTGNHIEDNWGNPNWGGDGGGVYVDETNAHLARNLIISNVAGEKNSGWARFGGGVLIVSGKLVTMSNNLVALNDGTDGAGVCVGSGSLSEAFLVNNTIADNTGYSGIQAYPYAVLTMTNNLVTGHGIGLGVSAPLSSTVVADTNLFWNTSDPTTGTNAILEDPLLKEDYHLCGNSPAVDAGLTISWLTEDLEGNARPHGLGYDIGAYEFYAWQYLPLVLKRH
jgi:hypothetical protein